MNAVPYYVMKNALMEIDKDEVVKVLSIMGEDTGPILRSCSGARNGSYVLYYFWVRNR